MNYRIVRKDNGPANPHTGVVSQHESADLAFDAFDIAQSRLMRASGSLLVVPTHPYEVQELADGVWVKAVRP